MNVDCPYGKLVKTKKHSYILCDKSGMSCAFQRYCTQKRSVVFSAQANQCKLRKDE